MNQVELLAPARDLETGIAAINCGADAVYLGASKFGARESAGNPLDTILQLADYAHKYWARVYVTVNTLLRDDEIDTAVDLIHAVYEAGADAVIIQDAGLLECDLPLIPLFASTQMHNLTPGRVAFLEKVGIRRVILPRELSLDQIRAIRAQAATVELESFVHGALCVSYSGQCYLSYALGGRSGNRGQCAQPCRKIYRLEDASGKILEPNRHLLSLRDLNLSDHLEALLDAGIRSFKIEGRLKDRAYVMNVVGYYRQKLDAILEGRPELRAAASGRVHFDFQPDPRKTFNRGYTTYFVESRGAPVASWDSPKSLGEPVGTVVSVSRRSFTLDGSVEIHPGDGLCFFDTGRVLCGTTVNEVQGRQVTPLKMDGFTRGTQVFRNHDHAFLAALERSQAGRKIAVDFLLSPAPGGLSLACEDEDGVRASFALECDLAPAEKPEAALATVEKQLQKLGGTDFTCRKVIVNLPAAPFIPVSALNALRRGAVDALAAERIRRFPRLEGGARVNLEPYPEKLLGFEGNVLNEKAAAFYRRHGVTLAERAAESGLAMAGRRVMTTKYCIKHELGACPRIKGNKIKLNEPLVMVDEQGVRLPLRFACARCEMEVYYQQAGKQDE